eukprot:1297153-Alexandrium_andersonii.AAC.1
MRSDLWPGLGWDFTHPKAFITITELRNALHPWPLGKGIKGSDYTADSKNVTGLKGFTGSEGVAGLKGITGSE